MVFVATGAGELTSITLSVSLARLITPSARYSTNELNFWYEAMLAPNVDC